MKKFIVLKNAEAKEYYKKLESCLKIKKSTIKKSKYQTKLKEFTKMKHINIKCIEFWNKLNEHKQRYLKPRIELNDEQKDHTNKKIKSLNEKIIEITNKLDSIKSDLKKDFGINSVVVEAVS